MFFDKEKALWVNKPDMVEVVRCWKCGWYDPDCEFCQFWHGLRHPGHYCGEGEQKTNG